jgi:hypothetical protein
MNINDFKKNINKTILERGYNYYTDGNIIETYEQEENTYIFEIQGSEDYQVIVIIDENGEIIYSECNCPYDFGPICKHEAAAYFKLSEDLNDLNNNRKMKKEKSRQPEIKEILSSLSKQQLIDILVDITKKDSALKDNLIFRYSKGDSVQEIKKCKKLISSIVRKYKGRERFISYREAYRFVCEMWTLLDKVRETDDILLAIDIAFLVLDEGIEAFQYADDSDGDIGNLVSETLSLIEEIIISRDELDINLEEKMFQKLLDKSDSKVFDDWDDYKIDMLRICAEFADVEKLRNELRGKIEDLIVINFHDEYKEYFIENMLQIIFMMIEEYGTEEEAEQFIRDNLKFPSFRELLIKKYVEEKNYKKVIEMALEGEIQDKKLAGLVMKWKKLRYSAYKELSMKEEQKALGKELLFNGNLEYYKELKELAGEDRELFYNNLIQELKKDSSWSAKSIYINIILEENDLNEIMELVREDFRYIVDYAELLVDKFKDEVIDIYKEYIKFQASRSSNRSHYKNVRQLINKYKKIAGPNNKEQIINELCSLYRKKPAFLDELSKIK